MCSLCVHTPVTREKLKPRATAKICQVSKVCEQRNPSPSRAKAAKDCTCVVTLGGIWREIKEQAQKEDKISHISIEREANLLCDTEQK
jgi:hypothetical protein